MQCSVCFGDGQMSTQNLSWWDFMILRYFIITTLALISICIPHAYRYNTEPSYLEDTSSSILVTSFDISYLFLTIIALKITHTILFRILPCIGFLQLCARWNLLLKSVAISQRRIRIISTVINYGSKSVTGNKNPGQLTRQAFLTDGSADYFITIQVRVKFCSPIQGFLYIT